MKTGSPLAKKPWRSIVYWAALALLMGLSVFILLFNVEKQLIISHDEGRHGVTAYEMVKSGDYIYSTNRGEPDYWNLKPPLSFWAIALGFRLFGYTYFGFRFQCILASFLLLLVVALWTKRRHGALVSIATILFLVINPVYFERTSDAGGLYLLFTTLAMLFMLDSERNIRWLYGSALCFGFAFMAKSYHAALIPLVCFLYVCATGKLKQLKWKNYLTLVFLGLLPIVPWAVARYLRDGTEFFVRMFTTDVIARVGDDSPVAGANNWYFYLANLAANPAVVTAGVVCAMGLGSKLTRGGKLTSEQIGLGLWLVVPVVFFSFSKFKLPHYVHMMMPALTIAAGRVIGFYWNRDQKGHLLKSCALILAVALIIQTIGNVNRILQRGSRGSYQTAIGEMFDREFDSGLHVYIQASKEISEWSQADMLCAIMQGDVLCLDGGAEAFEQDEEPAVLIVDKACVYDVLEGEYYVRYESSYLYAFEN